MQEMSREISSLKGNFHNQETEDLKVIEIPHFNQLQ